MLKKVLANNQVIWFCLISVLFFVCNTDVHAQNEKEQSILDTFGHEKNVLDGLFSEKPELARLLSPVEYLTKTSPPILLLHGDTPKDRVSRDRPTNSRASATNPH